MKIDRIAVYRLPIDFGETRYTTGASGAAQASIDGTILRLDTDEGLVGWGEISPWGRTYLPEFAEGARAGIDVLAPALIGADPTDIAALHAVMDRHLDGHAYVKSGFDIAAHDLFGKSAGLPVYRLLGGLGCDRIPMNCAVYHGPFEEMAERIAAYRERPGYRIFSTKPGGEAVADIALYERLADIRRPDEIFIADANRLWTLADALRIARAIEPLGFNLEQPCATYEACLRVRRATGATMTLDESVTDGDVLARLARDNAADIVHVKLSRIGGLAAARRFTAFCEIAGLSLSWASSGGTEIADMAALHAAAATPRAHLFGLWSCREFNTESHAQGAFEIVDGVTVPGTRAGLGIGPDEAALGQPIALFR